MSVPFARAQLTTLDHQTATPNQAALGEVVLQHLLTVAGSDAVLFRKVTGQDPLPTQKLFLNVPDAALQLGPLTYANVPELLVATLWDQAALCQTPTSGAATNAGGKLDTPAPSTSSAKPHPARAKVVSNRSFTVTNSGQWSNVSTPSHSDLLAIEVNPALSEIDGAPSHTFQFLPARAAPARSEPTVLRFSTPLTADYGTKVVYRQQAVVLRGAKLPFSATAQVTSNAPLKFNVRTLGVDQGFYFNAGEQRLMHLSNLPTPGDAQPAQDARLGGRVLMSPNGAFLLGREHGTAISGAYSLVDAMRSTRTANGIGTLSRVWTSRAKGSCATADLALNTAGDLVAVCDGTANWVYKNTAGDKPCRHLVVSNAGELICYSAIVDGANPGATAFAVFATRQAPNLPDTSRLVNTQHEYQLTWQELTGTPSQTFSFTGTYTGDHVVSPVVSCQDAVVNLPAGASACERAVDKTDADRQCTDIQSLLATLRDKSRATASRQQ